MTEDSQPVTLGLDRVGRKFVSAVAGENAVSLRTLRIDNGDVRSLIMDSARIESVVAALPDRATLVKSLRVYEHDQLSIEECLRFELTESVLGTSDDYQFETVVGKGGPWHLGLVSRRGEIEECLAEIVELSGTDHSLCRTRMRALALGQGFLHSCRVPGTGLHALVDSSGSTVSVCLIRHDTIVDLAWLALPADSSSEPSPDRLVGELKTLLNFRLSRLADREIRLPLAGLVVSGGAGTDESISPQQRRSALADSLSAHFSCPVSAPVLRKSFAERLAGSAEDAAAGLVAIGLALG